MKEDIENAITLLADHGFEVHNKRGGYFGRIEYDRDGYFHQTGYRSTSTGPKKEILESFLSESEQCQKK